MGIGFGWEPRGAILVWRWGVDGAVFSVLDIPSPGTDRADACGGVSQHSFVATDRGKGVVSICPAAY